MGKFYHYTTTQGFESIIKNKCIRMTRSDFLNDPHDCRVFFDIVEAYIAEKMKNIPELMKMAEVRPELMEHMEKILMEYPIVDYMKYVYRNVPMYMLSLTDESDSLPMWNYYGGEGLRFGFDSEILVREMSKALCNKSFEFLVQTQVEYIDSEMPLSKLTLDSFSNFYVREYSDTEQRPILRKTSIKHHDGHNLEFFIDSYIKSYIKTIYFWIDDLLYRNARLEDILIGQEKSSVFKMIFENNKNVPRKSLRFKTDIDIYMLILAARYKTKTFENEAETRIVFFNYDIENRPTEEFITVNYKFGSFIRPFIECPLSMDAIEDILLAPSAQQMPIELEVYKNVLRNFMKKDKEFPVNTSQHEVRW